MSKTHKHKFTPDQNQTHCIVIAPTRVGMSMPADNNTVEHEANEADIHQAHIEQWNDYYEYTGMADLARASLAEEEKNAKSDFDT